MLLRLLSEILKKQSKFILANQRGEAVNSYERKEKKKRKEKGTEVLSPRLALTSAHYQSFEGCGMLKTCHTKLRPVLQSHLQDTDLRIRLGSGKTEFLFRYIQIPPEYCYT